MCWVSGKSYQVKPLAKHYGWEQSVEALSDPPSTWKVGFAGPIHRAHGKLGLRGLRCFRWCWLTFASRFCGWRGSACKVWKARVSHIGLSTSRMFSHGHCWNRLWPSEVAFASVFFDHGQRRMVWKPKEYKMHAVGRDYTEGKGDRKIDRHFCIPVATPRYTQKLEKWPRKNYIWHRWNVVQWCIYCCVATCIYNDLHTYMHTYIRTYIHTYIHTYIPTYLHTYIPTYLHTHIRTYLHTYIHTYIPTYLHSY